MARTTRVTVTQREAEFCVHFLTSGNAAYAVEKAGYKVAFPRQYGYRLLQKDYIKRYLQKASGVVEELYIAPVNEVLATMTRVMRGGGLPRLNESDGGQIVYDEPGIRERMDATKLLAQYHKVIGGAAAADIEAFGGEGAQIVIKGFDVPDENEDDCGGDDEDGDGDEDG